MKHQFVNLLDRTRSIAWDLARHWPTKPELHFLHIGKTGGTAIRHALSGTSSPRYRMAFESHDTRMSGVPAGTAVFFLRDPLDRFASGFWSRFRQGLPRYASPWTAGEMKAFVKFRSPSELAERLPDRDAVEAMRAITHVRTPQVWWIDRALESAAFVGLMETFQADFHRLCDLLDVQAVLPQSDAERHRNPTLFDYSLSPQARRKLLAWYAEDVALVESVRNARISGM